MRIAKSTFKAHWRSAAWNLPLGEESGEGPSTGTGAVVQEPGELLHKAHLCDLFHGACGEIRRGESEPAVGASVERLEVKGQLLFPLVALAQVNAVHPHEPVGTGNHLHHQGQLGIREKKDLCGLHLSCREVSGHADTHWWVFFGFSPSDQNCCPNYSSRGILVSGN